ncbi:MAG TPA: hypothetical protein VFW16_13290 [Streptosporangiaceae bacterium]|nr:hypothetical protein [Streptosporangiaceae bacterium]
MGLMDRVKQQASALAQQANESMAKLDNLPAQRRADALLRSLGVAVLADKTGRATGNSEEQIARILDDIAQHERQYNVDLVQQAAQAAQAQQPWQQGQPNQPWQPGQPNQPWQPGPPGQPGQPWQPPQGDFLTSAPPAGQNAPAPPGPPGPGYGGSPGYGAGPGDSGQPTSGPPGWGQQGIGQQAGQMPQSAFPGGPPAGAQDPDEPGRRFPPGSGS